MAAELWWVELEHKPRPRERKQRVTSVVALAESREEAERLALDEAGADVWPDRFRVLAAEPHGSKTISMGLRFRNRKPAKSNDVWGNV